MLRVLHAPVNVGNQPWVVSRNERALGLRSELIIDHGSWLKYNADRCLGDKDDPFWRIALRQIQYGLLTPWRYDVMHYYAGASFLGDPFGPRRRGQFLDLRLARLLGRKIFMTLQGCDVRQSDRHSQRNPITMCHLGHCGLAAVCRASRDDLRRDFIKRILPLCDRVFALNPDLMHFVPDATFLPYGSVEVESVEPVAPKTEGPIKLLHAPTDERIKGTQYVLAAVEKLKSRWPIELILVRGLPHADAVKAYAQADLVIDQLLSGWYGGFAVEAMALGKPVASYVRETDLHHIPQAMRREIAVRNVTPESLEADLETMFRHRAEWPKWGRQSREYVLRWHHPRRIAQALGKVYRDPKVPFELDLEESGVQRLDDASSADAVQPNQRRAA